MIFVFISLFLFSAQAETSFSCNAQYDDLNITRQVTESTEHFYYCFGYHHGKDRAWEMDYFRRTGQGRNSEILGFNQLKADLMMKLLNLEALSKNIWESFEGEKKIILEKYAEGANEGFKIGANATEFKKFNFTPEKWKPEHTILVLLLQSFDQTRKTFMRDYDEEKNKEHWKEKAEELFNEDHMPWDNTILKEGEYEVASSDLPKTTLNSRSLKLWSEFPTVFGLESGSNNWVVSSAKSKTGNALLANDPHLDLKTPLFWYWVNLKSPEGRVLGASVPGVPVVVSGTNGNVAWGLTNSYYNSADIMAIKNLPSEKVEVIWPRVDIKLWFFKIPFFFKSFERLKSGHPVLPLETELNEKLALRWAGYSLKAHDFYPMFDLFKGQNVSETHSVILKVGVPSWNFVYADKAGEIGYGLVGKTYKTIGKTPLGIPLVSLEEFEREEFLEPHERPSLLKPVRHYIYSANNRHWPTDAKFYGGRGYSESFRGFRIDEMLQAPQDIDSFKTIQCDREAVDARFFLPKLQKLLDLPEFKYWDRLALDQSRVMPLYRRLMDLMMKEWKVNEYALYRLLDQLNDQQVKELQGFHQLALADIGERNWNEVLFLNFPHMSKSEALIFSPVIPGVGDKHSVNPGTSKWNEEKKIYEHYSGASMRLIIEMGEVPRIFLSLPGLNRFYDQQPPFSPWEEWRRCDYREVVF